MAANGVDPAQPAKLLQVPEPPVMISLLEKWREQRKGARVLIVLDVSGSMEEPTDPGDPSSETKLELAKTAAIDALDGVEGNLYTTTGGGIAVYDKGGKKIGLIPVAEQPANVCFGGDDYKTLFITARTSLYSVPVKIAGAKPKGAKW